VSAANPSDPQSGAIGSPGTSVDAESVTPPDAPAAAQAHEDAAAPAAAVVVITAPGQLSAAREARGWTVADLASKLGMMPRQIEAIERGDWEALPGQAFVRGAIRACGKALNADVETLISSTGGAVRAAELRPAATLEAPLPRHGALGFDNGGSGSRLTWILLAILGVIAIAMYFGRGAEWSRVLEGAPTAAPAPGRSVEAVPLPAAGGSTDTSRSTDATGTPGASGTPGAFGTRGASGTPETPSAAPRGPAAGASAAPPAPVPQASSAAPASAATPPPAGEAAPGSAPVAQPIGAPGVTAVAVPAGAPATLPDGALRFSFDRESWVDVRDARGKTLLHGMQPAGSAQTVTGARPYSLTVGNAVNVRLEHDGRQVDLGAIARHGVARLKID